MVIQLRATHSSLTQLSLWFVVMMGTPFKFQNLSTASTTHSNWSSELPPRERYFTYAYHRVHRTGSAVSLDFSKIRGRARNASPEVELQLIQNRTHGMSGFCGTPFTKEVAQTTFVLLTVHSWSKDHSLASSA